MMMTASKPGLSLLISLLLLASPQSGPSFRNQKRHVTIQRFWAAEAMSPTAELTAAAAAAVVRRNVISGAAIFTFGDAAAQMLTASKFKKKEKLITTIPQAPGTGAIDRQEDTAITPQSKIYNFNLKRRTLTSSLDITRLWSSTVLGAIWSGFCVPFIYGNVERTFPGKANLRQILIKVFVTCSILSTIGNYVTMFARRLMSQYTMYQFDRTSSLRLKWGSKPIESIVLFFAIFKGCFKSCNRDIVEVIVDDLKIWPLYDLACYSLIPPAWRPITTSIMSSGWAMYMSVVSAKEEEEDDEEVEDSNALVDNTMKPTRFNIEPATPQTFRVTPLDPFPKPPNHAAAVATCGSTIRLIRVHGGETSESPLSM